jgi:hypothetical protein
MDVHEVMVLLRRITVLARGLFRASERIEAMRNMMPQPKIKRGGDSATAQLPQTLRPRAVVGLLPQASFFGGSTHLPVSDYLSAGPEGMTKPREKCSIFLTSS